MVAEPYYTNRDRFLHKLVNMSDRELANLYCLCRECRDCQFVYEKGCFNKLTEWLKQETNNG